MSQEMKEVGCCGFVWLDFVYVFQGEEFVLYFHFKRVKRTQPEPEGEVQEVVMDWLEEKR